MAYGGEFTAGPRAEGGYAVYATIAYKENADQRSPIADDQALLRGSFRLLIESAPDMTVVGEAATGIEAVNLARAEQPDVILMDIRMPDMDGIEATRRISTDPQTANARVLILTTFDLDDYVYAALRARASGLLLKDVRPAVCWPVFGRSPPEKACSPRGSPGGSSRSSAAAPSPAALPPTISTKLTDREREVLCLIATGLSNPELAADLHLAHGNHQDPHRAPIGQAQRRDRAQLVIAA